VRESSSSSLLFKLKKVGEVKQNRLEKVPTILLGNIFVVSLTELINTKLIQARVRVTIIRI